jgi:2-polyprenyl-3-methyl-5-hydroxy-6-metoxy-1,4-benzoquinol methylase
MVIDEHFVPAHGLDIAPYAAAGDVGAVHHLIRYAWALECLADLPELTARGVLDVACGAGYGSHAIAGRFGRARVVGADYDAGAVSFAREHYKLPNLEFRHGDVTRWGETIGREEFGCIVSFDTIEHVAHREIMMQNLVNHLRDDGALLLSTPCGGMVNDLSPEWEHHKIEYGASSLFDFVSRYFRTVLRPDDGSLPHPDVFGRLEGTGVSYLLKMNPLLCRHPVKVPDPFRTARPR